MPEGSSEGHLLFLNLISQELSRLFLLRLLLPNDNKVFVKRKTLMYVIFKLEKKYVLKAQHEDLQIII